MSDTGWCHIQPKLHAAAGICLTSAMVFFRMDMGAVHSTPSSMPHPSCGVEAEPCVHALYDELGWCKDSTQAGRLQI